MSEQGIPDFTAGLSWPDSARVRVNARQALCVVECEASDLITICERLWIERGYAFAGLIVEELSESWELRYVFYGNRDAGWVHVVTRQPLTDRTFPSISSVVHAADWHEREAEDLFGLRFEGHPRLGDFILHNDRWHEELAPMRHRFDASKPVTHRAPDLDWRPRRVVEAPGAFVMPIGPKFGGMTESVHFLLETVGEDVIRTFPRLFYKYRAIEKIAEGRTAENALLLAERFAAATGFSHALGFSQAVETICETRIPERARALRILLAEIERFRHHVGAIQEICESTSLLVANSQMAMLEEDLLRLSGALTGHRYLFGLAVPGGLARRLDDSDCRAAVRRAQDVLKGLEKLETMLRKSSSFLDRLEEVGFVSHDEAHGYGLVGPVARASNVVRDLRKDQPYTGCEELAFDVAVEREGDGYARLRVLFEECRQSVSLMEQVVAALPSGPEVIGELKILGGSALGWVEAPRGAAFHWLHLDDRQRITRYRLITPSFANWHGFHLAAEDFAFQDFPIILATFDLSVAESDR